MELIIKQLAQELSLKPKQVEATINLIDEGNTIPFIARYRKEVTGGIDDEVLRAFDERLTYLKNLESRKEEVIRLIDEQGKLTEDLKKNILSATVLQKVEDLYRPYKQKKATRASKAKDKGLEPLALYLMAQENKEDLNAFASTFIDVEKEVKTIEDALKGAMDIIAEVVADDPDYREYIREHNLKHGVLQSKVAKGIEESVYEMYYDYNEGVEKVANHRILALNRGEKEKVLKVKLISDDENLVAYLKKQVINGSTFDGNQYLEMAIEDSYKRLITTSIEREIRNILTERAQEEAIKVFAKNTKPLLLVPPVKDVMVLAVDPSYRTGCKLAVLDGTGKLLEYATIYPNEPQNQVEKSKKVLTKLINKYKIDVIPIGNGTASRETEMLIADLLKTIERTVYYTIVSEAGASVYSASKLATEEYPDIDVSIRGAISIGRRLQDPLAELVKIDPKSIGVGQYQHDLNQKKLDESLKNVVEDCVNSVGVDLNIATPSLLQYVSGISAPIAKNIVAFRDENGKYTSRSQLKKVKRLGDKAYEQCAGFLRISDGKMPLDNTSVHPESYEITRALIKELGYTIDDVKDHKLANIDSVLMEYGEKFDKKMPLNIKGNGFEALAALKQQSNSSKDKGRHIKLALEHLSKELNVGLPTLRDIVSELKKPGRDLRDEMPKPVFRSDVLKMEDLRVDMEMTGTVRNVVDFGAFVDIGVKQDGLVHISQLADRFVKNPMDIVNVGDAVKVKIIDIDLNKKKIALTMRNVKQK